MRDFLNFYLYAVRAVIFVDIVGLEGNIDRLLEYTRIRRIEVEYYSALKSCE